ncbi:hypothetical protein OF83DRAFT_1084159 [Amylostereum chailletii]|nr:hypothetical protein OF83DRAFT_1084159 [Amylostereum chailletii]
MAKQTDRAGLSLLSLSIAAASATPIIVPDSPDSVLDDTDDVSAYPTGGASSSVGSHGSHIQGLAVHNGLKHRRLSSVGQSRKRHSDAREAAARPSPAGLQTAAAALSALSSLSLASTSPAQGPVTASLSSTSVGSLARGISSSAPHDDLAEMDVEFADEKGEVTKSGKKRGTLFTCESCSKVYRHPSCLIKHRWEHTPHWREASKFLLSKHQQVQLMEAAAILSHLSPTSGGSSLPDDRSLWPSFLSGGTLPGAAATTSIPIPKSAPASSSVPAKPRASSSGPRLHDYTVPVRANSIARLRPGVLGVPTGPSPTAFEPASRVMTPYAHENATSAVPVPGGDGSHGTHRYPPRYGSAGDEPWSVSSYPSSGLPSSSASAFAWAERSSSVSVSGTGSDESGYVDVGEYGYGRRRVGFGSGDEAGFGVKEEEEDREEEEAEEAGWDGMEMDMEL